MMSKFWFHVTAAQLPSTLAMSSLLPLAISTLMLSLMPVTSKYWQHKSMVLHCCGLSILFLFSLCLFIAFALVLSLMLATSKHKFPCVFSLLCSCVLLDTGDVKHSGTANIILCCFIIVNCWFYSYFLVPFHCFALVLSLMPVTSNTLVLQMSETNKLHNLAVGLLHLIVNAPPYRGSGCMPKL